MDFLGKTSRRVQIGSRAKIKAFIQLQLSDLRPSRYARLEPVDF